MTRARPGLPIAVAAGALAAGLAGAGCLRVPDAVRAEFVPQAGPANHYRRSDPPATRAARGPAPAQPRRGGS